MNFKSNRKNFSKISQKVKEGSTNSGGGDFRPLKMSVFARIIVFLTLLRMRVQFYEWGKNPPGGHKWDRKMCWDQILTSIIQFLGISIPDTL